jgi:hypothetical protein
MLADWLGLCPENKISGGKVLYTKSRRVRSRVATALRMAANSLHHAKDYLGEFFRRITRKLGKPQAITATAHKLARIVYHLLSTRRTETGTQQSHRMEVLKPLAVGYVGFPAGNILYMLCIDETHL